VRHGVVAALFVALVTALLAVHLAARARGADASRCERFEAASVMRSRVVTGSGERVVVIGDSYSAGLGLAAPGDSWPTRLDGTVHVAGFSGSGFSVGASACPGVSFGARATDAVARGADLVVVEGGLNDHDQPADAIREGFDQLLAKLRGHRVVIVGPPTAPARAAAVPRVDALLEELAKQYDAAYVRTSGWTLPYLDDRLHLTPAGHRAFGDRVARAIAAHAP
jgi:acyl-CoA thioesterase-1